MTKIISVNYWSPFLCTTQSISHSLAIKVLKVSNWRTGWYTGAKSSQLYSPFLPHTHNILLFFFLSEKCHSCSGVDKNNGWQSGGAGEWWGLEGGGGPNSGGGLLRKGGEDCSSFFFLDNEPKISITSVKLKKNSI